MSNELMAYSVVIPVFNAQSTLRTLYAQLVEHLGSLRGKFELIVVDDCSLDQSWEIIVGLANEDHRVRGVQLLRNSGQGAATMAGLAKACGQLVATMDDDLQNPPRELVRMFRFMEEHPEIDAVFGRPRAKNHSLWRQAGSTLVNRVSNLMFNQDPNFKLTSFRVLRRNVVLPLLRLNVPEPPIGALISTLTNRMANLDVDHEPRAGGKSGYTMGRLLRVSLSKFLGFSTFPLRFLAMIGMFGIAFSIGLGLYIGLRYVLGDVTVPGWTTLALLLIGVSGFMFLAFGIIGEYLQQILLNSRRNPTYVIRTEQNPVRFERSPVGDPNHLSTTSENRS